jgi:predicted molibdopterin-dependent oxidoreductase YjgC
MSYSSPADIMKEINALTPSYAGITYERLEMCHGLQWPCPNEEHPGTAYLHRDRFTKGKGTFLPCEFKPLAEMPDEEYDFLLTTGRIYYHYHTGTMTRRTSILEREAPVPFVEVNPDDAKRLGIRNGYITARLDKGQGGGYHEGAQKGGIFDIPLLRSAHKPSYQRGI